MSGFRTRFPSAAQAALAQVAALQRYALPEDQYDAWRQAMNRESGNPVRLVDVQVTGLERVSPDYVRAQLEMRGAGQGGDHGTDRRRHVPDLCPR